MTKKRVLIITGDPLGAKLAGPAIRAWNMAEQISRHHDVRLLSFTSASVNPAPFDVLCVTPHDEQGFRPHHDWADVVIFQGHALLVFDTLRLSRKILVIDIYDPMHLEQLEQARELAFGEWVTQVADATVVLNEQLVRGDYFICASERQRVFWLGQLAGQGRLNPYTYQNDPDLLRLIDTVPFGLSRDKPQHVRSVLKGVHPGIGVDDKLILWSGGLYNWFDPLTLIAAVAQLHASRPEIRLFFQGTKHPHPGVPEMEIVSKSRQLAKDLGVLDVAVFFNSSWVDFDERQNYLTEADLGVSTHHSHIETTFSFRTRVLDYLWAELPMVLTEGDHFAELAQRENLGMTVPASDADALAHALEDMLFNADRIATAKANIKRVREDYFWDVTLKPLVDFVDTATVAADRGIKLATGQVQGTLPSAPRVDNRFVGKLKAVRRHYREGGVTRVVEKLKNKLKRK